MLPLDLGTRMGSWNSPFGGIAALLFEEIGRASLSCSNDPGRLGNPSALPGGARIPTTKLQFRFQFQKKGHCWQEVRRAAGRIAPKSQWLSPILPLVDGLCSGLSHSPCPQSLAAPRRRREGAVLAVLVGVGVWLGGQCLGCCWEVQGASGLSLPPPSWSTIHRPPSISISASSTPLKTIATVSRRECEPLVSPSC